MGLTVDTQDTRAAFLTGAGMTAQSADGLDSDSTNGAQTIYTIADREGTPLLRVVRGTSGSTNLAVIDSAGVLWYVAVNSSGVVVTSASPIA